MSARTLPVEEGPDPFGDRFVLFRWLVTAMQAAAIWITWPLWNVRQSPPMLPGFALPEWDCGWLLIASLVGVLLNARWGILIHTLLLGWAMSLDQMRLQPEFLSQALLLWGTLPRPAWRTICRVHLTALWFYAGFNKLTCPDYYRGDARWLVTSFFPTAPEWLSTTVGVAIGVTEIGLAVCAIVPQLRLAAAGLGYLLHLGIIVTLACGLHWDPAVWPWNLSVAVAGYVLLAPWTSPIRVEWRQAAPVVRFAALAIVLVPCGYYFGLTDTYLCHVLYSNHAPVAWVTNGNGQRALVDTRPWLRVPVPQIARLYREHFAATGQPGEELEIVDPRLWFRWRGTDRQVFTYEQATGSQVAPEPLRGRVQTAAALLQHEPHQKR